MRILPITAAIAMTPLSAGVHHPKPPPHPVPAPPAWLRRAAERLFPSRAVGPYEAFWARGGAWLVKLTDSATGTPCEALFLHGDRTGRALRLGETYYSGNTATVNGSSTVFQFALREP